MEAQPHNRDTMISAVYKWVPCFPQTLSWGNVVVCSHLLDAPHDVSPHRMVKSIAGNLADRGILSTNRGEATQATASSDSIGRAPRGLTTGLIASPTQRPPETSSKTMRTPGRRGCFLTDALTAIWNLRRWTRRTHCSQLD